MKVKQTFWMSPWRQRRDADGNLFVVADVARSRETRRQHVEIVFPFEKAHTFSKDDGKKAVIAAVIDALEQLGADVTMYRRPAA